MIIINESGMTFGEYDEKNVFRIENSLVHKKAGDKVKSVEFILLHNSARGNKVVFIEAKTSCPNVDNKEFSEENSKKYEEYYTEITEKFLDSVSMFSAAIMRRYSDTSEIGDSLEELVKENTYRMILLLVIAKAESEWLSGPKTELENRLKKICQIWKCEVLVINREMASKYGFLCDYDLDH